ncbi:GNAT family N-acetyltransferase [Paenibacillus aquistagni]|uniref:GNAT family N-acetyltransferase n=1 Tax=Paenibacillus aquistagni TaxID=1852522 RepID=UPI00145B749B|nr:GNAT family N-acetyltransferase [Paenibacillus aquistagni]NMM54820.1 GNAT family N-acetyltransferase [Paenibacillus aquistagni]
MIVLDAKPLQHFLQPLLTSVTYVPSFAYAVLSSTVEGSIWVNDDKHPTTAVIGTGSGLYAVFGDASDKKVLEWLRNLYHDQYKNNEKRFLLFATAYEWEDSLASIMDNDGERSSRMSYELKGHLYAFPPAYVEAGFGLQRITMGTIAASTTFPESYYKENWGSVQQFMQKGFGYAVTFGGKIVSECTAVCLGSPYVEIDIATHPNYRGLGLGRFAAAAFIQHCSRQGLIPRWECDVSNVSSMRLAEKLDFSHSNGYTVFRKK